MYTKGQAAIVSALCIVGTLGILCQFVCLLPLSYVFSDASHRSMVTIRYKGTKFLDELLRAFEEEDGNIVGTSGKPNRDSSNIPNISYHAPLWIRNEPHKVMLLRV